MEVKYIEHDCIQRSDEWHALRRGIPTASSFSKLITPTGKPCSSAQGYINQLIAERISGQIEETYVSQAMQYGIDHESNAVAWYELISDKDVLPVGFCTNEEKSYGCSPDGFVDGTLNGIEIKCPTSAIHVSYLRENKVPPQYIPQIQGCMWILGSESWDFVSWHETLPNLLVTVERDDDFIAKLEREVEKAIKVINVSVKFIERTYK